jgi:Tfp pilus assembly protein PilN
MHDELSFLPEDFLERKLHRRTAWAGAALIAGATVTMGFLTLRANAAVRVAERSHAQIQRAYDDAAVRFAKLRDEQDGHRKVIHQATLAATLIERIPPSIILAELTNRLPDGASLMDVTLESRPRPEAPAASATIYDAKKAALEARRKADAVALPENSSLETAVRISGLADTDVEVAHYLSELSRAPLFQDVSLLISEAHTVPGKSGKTLRRFQIQMTVNPDVRLTPRPDAPAPVTADLDD